MVLHFLSQSLAHVSVTQQTHHVAIFQCFFSSLHVSPLSTQHRAWYEVCSQWLSLPWDGTSFLEAWLKQTQHINHQQADLSVLIAGYPAFGSMSGTQYTLHNGSQQWTQNRSLLAVLSDNNSSSWKITLLLLNERAFWNWIYSHPVPRVKWRNYEI